MLVISRRKAGSKQQGPDWSMLAEPGRRASDPATEEVKLAARGRYSPTETRSRGQKLLRKLFERKVQQSKRTTLLQKLWHRKMEFPTSGCIRKCVQRLWQRNVQRPNGKLDRNGLQKLRQRQVQQPNRTIVTRKPRVRRMWGGPVQRRTRHLKLHKVWHRQI
jgi:hypothetical protein